MFELLIVLSDSEVRLVCRGLFPYLDSWWDIWWTVDGKTLEKLPDHQRFSRTNRWKENIWFYYLKGPRSRYRLIFKYDRKPQFGVYLWRVFELQRSLLASFSLQFWICGTFTDFNQPCFQQHLSHFKLRLKLQKSKIIKNKRHAATGQSWNFFYKEKVWKTRLRHSNCKINAVKKICKNNSLIIISFYFED